MKELCTDSILLLRMGRLISTTGTYLCHTTIKNGSYTQVLTTS